MVGWPGAPSHVTWLWMTVEHIIQSCHCLMRFFFPASRCLERGWSLDPVERQHPHRQVMKFRESREVSFLPKPRWNLARSRATWAPLWETCLEIIGRVFVFVWGVLVAAPFCKSFYIKWFNWKMTSTSPIKFIDILSFCSNSQINRNGQVYASTTLTGRPRLNQLGVSFVQNWCNLWPFKGKIIYITHL